MDILPRMPTSPWGSLDILLLPRNPGVHVTLGFPLVSLRETRGQAPGQTLRGQSSAPMSLCAPHHPQSPSPRTSTAPRSPSSRRSSAGASTPAPSPPTWCAQANPATVPTPARWVHVLATLGPSGHLGPHNGVGMRTGTFRYSQRHPEGIWVRGVGGEMASCKD